MRSKKSLKKKLSIIKFRRNKSKRSRNKSKIKKKRHFNGGSQNIDCSEIQTLHNNCFANLKKTQKSTNTPLGFGICEPLNDSLKECKSQTSNNEHN